MEPAAYLCCIGMKPGGVTRYARAAGPATAATALSPGDRDKAVRRVPPRGTWERAGKMDREACCLGYHPVNPALGRAALSPSCKNHPHIQTASDSTEQSWTYKAHRQERILGDLPLGWLLAPHVYRRGGTLLVVRCWFCVFGFALSDGGVRRRGGLGA